MARNTPCSSIGRSILTVPLLALLATFFIGGCYKEQPVRPTRPAPITLRIIGEGYPPLLAFEKIKDQYERAHGVHIEITKKDHMAVVAEVDREFSTGKVTYELVLMPHRLLGKFVEKHYVRSLQPYLANRTLYDARVFDPTKDLLPGWWDEVGSYRGEPYGYPFMALTMYTWYRKDLFDNPNEQAAFHKRYGQIGRASCRER